jgi:type II secretory pathway pseudopilin PulG
VLAVLLAKFNVLRRNEVGVSLIETLIALALLGMISVPFLSGLATASKATYIGDERATAGSLARSQMEFVKGLNYIDYSVPGHEEYELIAPSADYSVEVTAVPIDPNTGEASAEDQGIQRIAITVKHGDKPVLIIEDYRVDR